MFSLYIKAWCVSLHLLKHASHNNTLPAWNCGPNYVMNSNFSALRLKKIRFYLFIHERHREAETQAEGEAGSLWGAWWETPSQDPGIMIWAKGRCSTPEPPGCPCPKIFMYGLVYMQPLRNLPVWKRWRLSQFGYFASLFLCPGTTCL